MAAIDLPNRPDLVRYSFGLELEGRSYGFEFYWNDRAAAWFFHLSDDNGDPILSGRRVSVGIPLLWRFADARLPPGELTAIDTAGAGVDPGLSDLGARVKLLYFESTETDASIRAG